MNNFNNPANANGAKNFFNLFDPVANYIDSGRVFRQPLQWLYYLIGGLCGILPLYAIYYIIDSRILKYAPGSVIFAVLLIWIILVVTCAVSLLLWFNRAKKLPSLLTDNSKFVAVPAIANLIQTFGEWIGIATALFGFPSCLIAALFASNYGIPYVSELGVAGAFECVIVGYIYLIISRYLAELILSIAEIANNSKKIADNSDTMVSK